MAVNDIYRVTIVGNLHGQDIQTVLHYRESVTAGANGQPSLAAAVDAAFAANVLTVISSEYTYELTLAQKIYPGIPQFPTANGTGTGTGGVGGGSLPTTVTAVVKKRTTLAGPRYRGRVFQAGIPLSYEFDSTITVAGRIALLNGWSTVLTGLVAGGYTFTPIIWHKDTLLFDDVNQLAMDLPLRVQRRREVGVGS